MENTCQLTGFSTVWALEGVKRQVSLRIYMDWNEWRKLCVEEGLTSEQTSESWKNYKTMREEIKLIALQGYTSIEQAYLDVGENESSVGNKFDLSQAEDVLKVAESVGQAISDAIQEELEEITDPDELDETLFVELEDNQNDLITNFAQMKDRIEYYEAKAKILRREADEAAEDFSKQIRRSLD